MNELVRRPHVLVVEDNDDHAALVRRAMDRSGHDWGVDVVHDESELEERLANGPPPDVLLVDVHLANGEGLDLIPRIRARRNLSHVPILVYTGDTDPGLPANAREKGASDFVRKPYSAAEYDVIANALKRLLRAG